MIRRARVCFFGYPNDALILEGNQIVQDQAHPEPSMTRALKIGDIVYTPHLTIGRDDFYLEEKKVTAISADRIDLEHVATLRRDEDDIRRVECSPSRSSGTRRDIEYYSRPVLMILQEFREQTDAFISRFSDDARKYGSAQGT